MNHEFKKFINTIQKVKLPEEKKELIRARIEEFIKHTPVVSGERAPLRSPFYFSRFTLLHLSKVASLVLIILITGGSTATFASDKALPGDVFYTVKVNIKEPIQEKLARTPEAKLQVQTKQIETRLTEAQTLLQKNDISPEKHKEVETRVTQKVEQISATIDKLQEEGDVETILATTGKLEPVLQAHKEALKEMATQTAPESIVEAQVLTIEEGDALQSSQAELTKENIADSLLETVERTLVAVEQQEVRALENIKTQEPIDIEKTSQEKIEYLTKKIQELNRVEKNQTPSTTKENDIDMFIDKEIQTINESIRTDSYTVSILEANLLLEQAIVQHEKNMFKEALESSQQGIKIIETLSAVNNIENATKQESLDIPLETQVGASTETKTTQ